VERASRGNGGRPAVIVSHSQGGYFALEFLNRSPLPWRRRYVMASMGPGGFLPGMRQLASTPGVAASAFTALPSPMVFGPGTPSLVVTRDRNYTASDVWSS
jgi:lysophospholipase-3